MKIQHAVILAAGRGKRMFPLTEVVPKPMAPIDGTTLIAKGIENILKYIPHVHITVGYKKSMLAKHVIELGVSSVINTEGKSNSWWIFNTLLSNIDEPIFVLTSDNIIELDFSLLERSYYALGEPACMLVPVKPISGLEGDYISHANNIVTGLDRSTPTPIYCSGVQIVHPRKVGEFVKNEGDFNDVWRALISKKQLYVSDVYPKEWISIDTVEQLESVQGKRTSG
ncbi:MAG: sugar phosphate nucleotidyltransferase [Gammaproteobacteria bacterium]|nr:sugar phosphate nucleotidyltransferase [Gammaproteobacteria bacterium]